MASRLASRDAAEVLWAAQEVWPPGPAFRTDACRMVRRLIPCDVVMFNRNDLDSGSIDYAVDPATWRPRIEDHNQVLLGTADDHPALRNYLSTGSAAPVRISDHLSDAEWFANPYFREYLAPLGLRRTLVQFIPSADRFVNVLALCTSGPEFTERDVAVLEALTPTLALGCGGVTHDDGKPVEVMAGWTLISITRGGEITQVSRDDTAFRVGTRIVPAAHRAVRESRYGKVVPVSIDGEAWLLQPLGSGAEELVVFARPADLEQDAVRRMTHRQRDILELVARGHTNGRVAHELGIAEGTVRKHVENILTELGAVNRAAAVAMWLRNTS